jgi:hypothetical protein
MQTKILQKIGHVGHPPAAKSMEARANGNAKIVCENRMNLSAFTNAVNPVTTEALSPLVDGVAPFLCSGPKAIRSI